LSVVGAGALAGWLVMFMVAPAPARRRDQPARVLRACPILLRVAAAASGLPGEAATAVDRDGGAGVRNEGTERTEITGHMEGRGPEAHRASLSLNAPETGDGANCVINAK